MWISVNSKYTPIRTPFRSIDAFIQNCAESSGSKPVLKYVPAKNWWVDDVDELVLMAPSIFDALALTHLYAYQNRPEGFGHLTVLTTDFEKVRDRCRIRNHKYTYIHPSVDEPLVLVDYSGWLCEGILGGFGFDVPTVAEASALYREKSKEWLNGRARTDSVRFWLRGFMLDQNNDVLEIEIDGVEFTFYFNIPELPEVKET